MSGGTGKTAGSDVLICKNDDVTVLHDPQGVLAHVLGDEATEAAARPRAQLLADVGAGAAAVVAAAATASTGEFVRLSPHSVDLLQQFGAVPAGDGFFHAFVQGTGGQIAGQLQWQPVSVAAQHALSLQLAAATLTLRLAIGNLEHAVERVEEQVELVRAFLAAQQVGDVAGNYVVVRGVTDRIVSGVKLAQADWDAVAGIGAASQRDIQRLRSWIAKRTGATSRRHSAANDAIRDLREPLALLTIAEQTLLLWHAVKLEQIRLREPEHVHDAIDESHATLRTQRELDASLRVHLATFVLERSRSPRIDGLVPGRYRSARELWKAGTALVDWFTEERSLEPVPIAPPFDWTAADAVDELRDRATETAHTGAELIGNTLDAARHKPARPPEPVDAADRPREITEHEDEPS